MARQKRRDRATAAPAEPDPTAPPSGTGRIGSVELVALALIVLTVVVTWLVRHVNNPDGVSYLDLTERLLAGDGRAFVQGYWSPFYSALVALLAVVAGQAPETLLVVSHLVNGAAVVGAVVLLWWWGRRTGGPLFARAAFAALFLVSFGFPRVEAVTPDILLLALLTWLAYELLVERGARWMATGLLLGATYLVKTSAWPWLLLSIPLRLWGARDGSGRRDVLLSVPVTALVMLLWIVPMSLEEGHPTFGSTGRLNYCWYLESCDSRTPDQHLGGHQAYRHLALDSTRSLVSAEFDPTQWTYAPWSDPTAWDAGVMARHFTPPTPGILMKYWGRLAWRTVSLWLLPVLVGVLLPWGLLEWRSERRRWWAGQGRYALVVVLLGVAGIVQFIVVHAEPRLIAPYAMFLTLGLLHGGTASIDASRSASIGRRVAGWLGLLIAVSYAHDKVVESIDVGREWDQGVATMAEANAEMASKGVSQERLVILGPAMPALRGAFLSGSRIVAQMPPNSVALLEQLPAGQQREVLYRLYGGKAQIAWRTTLDGQIKFIAIPADDGLGARSAQ